MELGINTSRGVLGGFSRVARTENFRLHGPQVLFPRLWNAGSAPLADCLRRDFAQACYGTRAAKEIDDVVRAHNKVKHALRCLVKLASIQQK